MTEEKPKTTALASWYGSNRMNAHKVGELLSDCNHVAVAFAGGMSELAHIDARTLLVNDAHRHVITLAEVAADAELGPRLYRQLRRVAFHPDTLSAAQARCKDREASGYDPKHRWAKLEWAMDYFVCVWMARNATAGTKKEFDAGLSYRWDGGGGDSAVRFRSATKSLVEWRRILERATFVCRDAFEFIADVKDDTGCGLYCDPPFPGPGDDYKHTFGDDGQRKLAEAVSRFKQTRVVMRFYDVEFIRTLYPASCWTWHRFEGRTQSNGKAPEVLITSKRPPAKAGGFVTVLSNEN